MSIERCTAKRCTSSFKHGPRNLRHDLVLSIGSMGRLFIVDDYDLSQHFVESPNSYNMDFELPNKFIFLSAWIALRRLLRQQLFYAA